MNYLLELLKRNRKALIAICFSSIYESIWKIILRRILGGGEWKKKLGTERVRGIGSEGGGGREDEKKRKRKNNV